MTTNTMNCEDFNDRLMAYLEHETDDATRAAIERHAVTCAECGALLADLRTLRIDATNLPELQPARDLWAGISSRIEAPIVPIGPIGVHQVEQERSARMRRWTRGAMAAASLVAAAGIGYVARGGTTAPIDVPAPLAETLADTSVQVVDAMVDSLPEMSSPAADSRNRGSSPVPTPLAVPVRSLEMQLAARAVATIAADYDREIARLRVLIEQRRNQLDPVTVAIIEKNLMVIDTAIADSKRAIVRDPASRYLIESLNQSLRSKVELMRTAALLPSRT